MVKRKTVKRKTKDTKELTTRYPTKKESRRCSTKKSHVVVSCKII